MLKATNAVEFISGLGAATAAMEKEATEVFRGFCVSVLFDILEENPQWSGNAVANWNFSTGNPDATTDLVMKQSMDMSSTLKEIGPGLIER